MQEQSQENAKNQRAANGLERVPPSEDNQRHCQPALAADQIVFPFSAYIHAYEQACQPHHCSAYNGSKVPIGCNADAHGVRCPGVFTHSAKMQAGTGFVEEKPHANRQDHADNDKEIDSAEKLIDIAGKGDAFFGFDGKPLIQPRKQAHDRAIQAGGGFGGLGGIVDKGAHHVAHAAAQNADAQARNQLICL